MGYAIAAEAKWQAAGIDCLARQAELIGQLIPTPGRCEEVTNEQACGLLDLAVLKSSKRGVAACDRVIG